MAKIFLSYAQQDSTHANALASALEERGNEVFFAGGKLVAGETWRDTLSGELRNADAVVVLVSPQSASSQWVIYEAGAAIGYMSEKGKPIVIPVVLGAAELPPVLAQLQAIFADPFDSQDVAHAIQVSLAHLFGKLEAKAQKRKEVKGRVEAKAADFIRESLESLKANEARDRRIAHFWYLASVAALTVGLAFASQRFLHAGSVTARDSWTEIIQLALVSLLFVGFLGALAKLAYNLGKGFMVEALRSSDRIHAISFGEFYLKAFGDDADWTEVKEVFQHWNIDKGSGFLAQDSHDVDPQVLHLAIELSRAIAARQKP